MANEEQLAILREGVEVWNKWRQENPNEWVDLREADLDVDKPGILKLDILLSKPDFSKANLSKALLTGAYLRGANLAGANLVQADLTGALLVGADLSAARLSSANLRNTVLDGTNLKGAFFNESVPQLRRTDFLRSKLLGAKMSSTHLTNLDLSEAIGLEDVWHSGPSSISTDTFVLSKGNIPEVFLRGCGLSDWEIESAKLYSPDLSNEEINNIQYRTYDLRATQALQISPLFVSYSHGDGEFVDKVGERLQEQGIRYWRDIHDLKAGRIEKQIDRAIRQNPTVLLVLSEHSLSSDWVEHEVRMARELEKEIGRDVLCPIALDNSWKDSRWPKRVMEQIMEYNILDFSAWRDDNQFGNMFRKLIDGLELFYKG